VISILWTSVTFLVSLAAFTAFVLISEQNILDPAKAFVSLALFESLRFPMTHIPEFVSQLATALVSEKRLSKFLNLSELKKYVGEEEESENSVTIQNGSFAWNRKPILTGIDLKIAKGSLVAIV